ncbi:trypsin 3A1 isoform X1 [Microplitis demolitor]|uniref:trypsin 3A1 isoform X1 n=1 Tax=Microplitis demolitor TaxID=69319 RepID=UPI0004CDD4B9|nr:trypsin 3A1 isoform X1 [Microplitis demolitor]
MLKLLIVFTLFAITTAAIPRGISSYDRHRNHSSNIEEKKNPTINEVSHHVSIQIHGVHYCSGAIISYRWIVTSAQCIVNFRPCHPLITIRAGTENRYNNGSIHAVDNYIVHPEFKCNGCKIPVNDIGLISIKDTFTFDNTRKFIKLHNNNHHNAVENQKVNVSGWDDNFEKIELSAHLKMKSWSTITTAQCRNYYFFIDEAINNMICAVSDDEKNPCVVGDLGNPMVVNGRLVGVKSYRMGCHSFPGSPTIYTSINSYKNWIKSNTGVDID